MRRRPHIAFLSDNRRLHLNDGPIDLIIETFGAPHERDRAHRAAVAAFNGLLDTLCNELPLLRSEARDDSAPQGAVARAMWSAVLPHAYEVFMTPMAAVAGAVADHVLAAMRAAATLDKAYVNNGGDIALHLAEGQSFAIGMIDRPDQPSKFGDIRIEANDTARGIATSGWRGRSFSLGIADAVTVLARDAATADAAATRIANAVDLPGHPAIHRVPANEVAPDSDLGTRLVTRGIGDLTNQEIATALASGAAVAGTLFATRMICAAALHLAGETVTIGDNSLLTNNMKPVAKRAIGSVHV